MVSPDRNGPDNERQLTEAELSERRSRLVRELEERSRTRENSGPASTSSTGQGAAQAMKLSTEFVAGVLVGAGIGWLIDRSAGTSPWGLIVFLLLGFVAGVLNVLRSAGVVADPAQERRGDRDGQT